MASNQLPKLPLKLSTFIEFQRKHKIKELGTDLDAADKELCEAVVLTANLVYHSILNNNFQAVENILGDMEDSLGFDLKNPHSLNSHSTVLCCWVQIAAKQAISELPADMLLGPFSS